MYFDTHAHYDDDRFQADREEVLADLKNAGVTLAMDIGCDMTTSLKAVQIAESHPFVYAAVGTHPHEAQHMKPGDLELYRALCQRPKVRAIGEIGLDYYYDNSPREAQRV